MELQLIANIISQLNKIPISVINKDEDINNFCNKYRFNTVQSWMEADMLKKQINRLGETDVLEVIDSLEVRFIVMKINDVALLIGPYTCDYLSSFEGQILLKKNKLPPDVLKSFLMYRDQLFHVSNDRVYNLITILFENLSNKEIDFNYIIVNPAKNQFKDADFLKLNENAINEYYLNDHNFIDSIKKADAKSAIKLWNNNLQSTRRESVDLTKISAYEHISLMKLAAAEIGMPNIINEKISHNCKEKIFLAKKNSSIEKEIEKLIKEYSKYIEDITIRKYSAMTMEIKSYIDDNYPTNIVINDLAKAYKISSNYLISSFKKDLGITPNQYLIQVRMKKAKILLLTKTDPIDNIASEVGIFDANYFSKQFRQYTKETPREYRKNRLSVKK